MSGPAPVRRPAWRITYLGRDISAELAPFVENISVCDDLNKESSDLTITLENRDGRWARAWFPKQEDRISVMVGYDGEELVNYGAFKIDEVNLEGPPDTVSIRALAATTETGKRTTTTRAWESMNFGQIAATIAGEHGLSLVGEIAEAKRGRRWKRISQHEQSDLAFLRRLGRGLGVVFNIKDEKLIWHDRDLLDAAGSIATIKRTWAGRYSFRAKTTATYRACTVQYHDPGSKELLRYTCEAPGMPSGDTLVLRERCESRADAEDKARAALRESNGRQIEGSVTLTGTPILCAGANVDLTGFGVIDGRYQISRATHSISRRQGYTTGIEVATPTAQHHALEGGE